MANQKKAKKALAKTVGAIEASAETLKESIRQRAYELYEKRGGANGCADEDWLRAEAELLAQHRNGNNQ